MIPLTAQEGGEALGLSTLAAGVERVSHDTRSLCPGDLFVAIRGESHDGHDYVPEALARGASGVVVETSFEDERLSQEGARLYRVPDTVKALGALARAVRRKSRARVIAVTGSVGKTTTKDLLRSLAGSSGPVVATVANQNNEVGVPLTLLALTDATRVAVVEMGMRGKGQIAALAAVAEPDVGLITNVAPVHLELLGSLDEVVRAKAELLGGLPSGGVGVLPRGAPQLEQEAAKYGKRLVRFGFGAGGEAADVWGTLERAEGGARRLDLRWPGGGRQITLPWSSRHRFENAVAAAAAIWAAGLDLDRCLEALPATVFTPLRGDELELNGIVILDDTYNANPPAMRVALDTVADRAAENGGRAVAVLGDMLELGPDARRYHREVGIYAAEAGVDVVWGVGPLSRSLVEGYRSQGKVEGQQRYLEELPAERGALCQLAEELTLILRPRDVVLVKASRGMRLERVVQALRLALGESPAASHDDQSGVLG